MAKASGLGWTTLSVDDVSGVLTPIKNDVTNLNFTTPRSVTDITGIDMSAIERMLLLADFSVSLNGQWNGSGVHLVLRTVTSIANPRSTAITVDGQTLNNEVIYSEYTVARAQGGDLNWSASAALSDGTVPTWS